MPAQVFAVSVEATGSSDVSGAVASSEGSRTERSLTADDVGSGGGAGGESDCGDDEYWQRGGDAGLSSGLGRPGTVFGFEPVVGGADERIDCGAGGRRARFTDDGGG